MTEEAQLIEALDNRVRRRNDRREFFENAMRFGAAAAAGTALVHATGASAQSTVTDADILNFALNLEYLEANFYSFAAVGTAIPASLQSGVTTSGAQGTAVGGRQVQFSTDAVRQYANEIYQDELAHVRFLRNNLGSAAVAQPAIDVSSASTGAFSRAAQAAGLVPAGTAFDAYANEENFLLAAFIFEDVGVTAYKGAAPLISNKNFLEAAAGILAVEAYHAAIVRTVLYRKGIDPTRAAGALDLIGATEAISDARDRLDGTGTTRNDTLGRGPDDDQGIRPITTSDGPATNIVPLNPNGLAYSRTAGQTLNIVYLTGAAAAMGGFFPAGVNGTIRTSAASG